MKKNHSERYDALSKAFHWITAAVVVTAFVLGPGNFGRLIRDGIDPGTQAAIVWHESLGIAVLGLTFLRLVWVAVRPSPPRFSMAGWMYLASRLAHVALWTLLLALPVTALLALGSEAHPLTILGGLRINELPFIAHSRLANLTDWGDTHKFLGDAIMWLAGIHALAAIYHHFRLKDGVLASMLP